MRARTQTGGRRNEKERREGRGWVNSGLWRFCNPVEAFRGERGIGWRRWRFGWGAERASERARRRRGVSRKEKAEGSRSFAGDGKRNRERPRWIERVEIDAKDGDDESERAAAVAAGGNGRHERREGRDFTYLHSHPNGGPRAARRANARQGAREKERRQRLGISPVARAQKAP